MQHNKQQKIKKKVDLSNSSEEESTSSGMVRGEARSPEQSDNDTCDSDTSFTTPIDCQESKTDSLKDQYFLSLVICFTGIIACYTGYGYLQEYLLSDQSKKMNINFCLGVQSVLAVFISSTIIKVFNMGPILHNFDRDDVSVGALNFFSVYCSNFALKYVNYPFMALAKSAKILPVILTGWLTGVYKLKLSQVIMAFAIAFGLIIFHYNSSKGDYSKNSPFGIFLVILSLTFDGFVNSSTDKNHQSKNRAFAYHTMLYNALISILCNAGFFAFAWYYHGDDTVERVLADVTLMRDIILMSLCGAVGQIFIYLTISLFDCYKLSIMTTFRKGLTIDISAFMFDHEFSWQQWIGATMVLCAISAEVYCGQMRSKEHNSRKKQQEDNYEEILAELKKEQ